MKIPSKKELDENRSKFPPIPSGIYHATIVNLKKDTRKKYHSEEMEDVITFYIDLGLDIQGNPPCDIEGTLLPHKQLLFTANPERVGFQQDGTPSKMRCLLFYALGQNDIEGDLDYESPEQLLGKPILTNVLLYTNQKGAKSNKIIGFMPSGK